MIPKLILFLDQAPARVKANQITREQSIPRFKLALSLPLSQLCCLYGIPSLFFIKLTLAVKIWAYFNTLYNAELVLVG